MKLRLVAFLFVCRAPTSDSFLCNLSSRYIFHSSKQFCLDRLSACYPFFFLSSLLPRVSANLHDNQYRFAQTYTVLNKHTRARVPTFWLDERALYPSNPAKCDFISTLDDKLKWRHSHHLHDNQQLSIMPVLVFDADSKPFPVLKNLLRQSYDLSHCLPVFLSRRAFTLQQNTRGCGWFSPHSHSVLKSLWKTRCTYVVSSSPLSVYRAWAAPLQLLLQAHCI